MIEHRVHTASYPPLRYPPSKWRVSRDESLLSRFSRVQRFRSDRQTRVDDRRRRRRRLLSVLIRSSDGEELRSRAPLFHHGACACARACVCVCTCMCARCVASVVVAHVCLVVGYANPTSLCAFVVRVCRVWPVPWLGKWDDPVVTRSEDHRGGAATGNQPRIDPVSRRLSSFSRLSFAVQPFLLSKLLL